MEEEYVKIPKKEWYHIKDWFSRVDELLEVIAKLLMRIDKHLKEVTERIKPPEVVPTPTPPPPTPVVPTPTPTPTEIVFPKYWLTRTQPYVPLRSVKYEVSSSEDTLHKFLDETEMFIISFFDDDLKIDLLAPTNENTPIFPEGSVILFERAKSIKNMYLRAVSGTARVYIVEFAYTTGE